MIADLTDAYLKAVDDALPGLVEKLYVVGSAALGKWQPEHSDVDTMIFTSRVPAESDLAALREVHAAMPAKPHLDGVYLSPDDDFPSRNEIRPFVVDGELKTGKPCGELTPVVWLTLQRYGIAVRGPAVGELDIRVDLHALRAYNLDNLRTFWRVQAADIPSYVAGLDPAAEVDALITTFYALGPARLHYTLATTDITSKSGAGEYIIATFPAYRELAARAIRWRGGEPVTFTPRDLGQAAELTEVIVDDAWRRWG
jgi:hypothetical protein